ncbi:MAG: hypothetical protein ACKVOG_05325 [Rhodoglobus sp.]
MRSSHTPRAFAMAIGASLALVLVTGCTPTSGPDDAGATRSSPPAASETATPTPDASGSEPTVAPFVIDCTSIIPASRQDWLATSGWPLFAPADFFAKVRSEVSSSPYILMQDNGGIVCPYATSSEVVVAYGYAPLADSQVAEADSLIIGTNDGYVTSSYAGGTLYDSATEGNAFEFFLIVPGAIFVATTTEILDEMLATVP